MQRLFPAASELLLFGRCVGGRAEFNPVQLRLASGVRILTVAGNPYSDFVRNRTESFFEGLGDIPFLDEKGLAVRVGFVAEGEPFNGKQVGIPYSSLRADRRCCFPAVRNGLLFEFVSGADVQANDLIVFSRVAAVRALREDGGAPAPADDRRLF